MRLVTLSTLGLCLVAGLIHAQSKNVVSPAGMANASSGIYNSMPWGGYGSTEQMCQQIHDVVGQVLMLKGMAFRHAHNMNYRAKSYTATFTVGEAAANSSGISSTFASNWRTGGLKTIALKGTINFPAFTAQAHPPAPFDAPVPFSTTVIYLGQNPLMWEVYITASNPYYPRPLFELGQGGAQIAGIVGKGCMVTGMSSPMTSFGFMAPPRLSETLTNGPASGPLFFGIGLTGSTYGGQPLPLNLGFMGSPKCDLNIAMLLYFLAPSSSMTLPYTWSTAIAGQRFRTQWAGSDGGKIVTSNGLDHSLPYGSAWPCARVYAYRFGTTVPATGTIHRGGLVVQFRQ